MPREQMEIPHRIDHLSILNEHGEVDDELRPDVDDELLVRWHRLMLLSRRFDERLLQLQREGQIGTFAPVQGQEAAQIGAASALDGDDWLVPAFRETAAALWRGMTMEGILIYNAGYNEGGTIPKDKRDFPFTIPVATQIPCAVGMAYAEKYRSTDRVALTFFGDGATSEGDFHEGLNFAGVYKAPVVFVCQNNQWAISTPRDRQTASKTLAQKALAYGLPGIFVDGNDVMAVYAATREAVERARAGDGATLIECNTYRMSVHTTADDPRKYRGEEEVEKWRERDPITRLQRYLVERDLLSEDDIGDIEDDIHGEIEDAWKSAKDTITDLGDPITMFDHVYAEMPAYLKEQRDWVRDGGDGGKD